MGESIKWYRPEWRWLCVARANGKSQMTTTLDMLRYEVRKLNFENKHIRMYPNKRVVHLALHGHGRTRKKNRNRALKWALSNVLGVKK